MTLKKLLKAIQALEVDQTIDIPKEHLLEVNKIVPLMNVFGKHKYLFNGNFDTIKKVLKDGN